MKKLFLIGTLIIMMVLPSFAQKKKQPKRQILFTLERDEIIFENEFAFQFNIKGNNYCCVVQNQETHNTSIIWNGKRIASGGYVEYLDLKDFNNSVYTYATEKGQYIHCNRKDYGPYISVESMMFDSDPMTSGRFIFTIKEDVDFMHDYDGFIYKLKEGRFEYSSINKTHNLQIDKDYKYVTLDGQRYDLPTSDDFSTIITTDNQYPNNTFVLNNGTCLIEVKGYNHSHNFAVIYYRIKNGKITKLKPNETIDFQTSEIVISEYHPIKEYSDVSQKMWAFFDDFEYVLNDPSDSHTMFVSWENDYVLIDGEKYGYACPLDAVYDKKLNAFVWYTIELNQLVRYIYHL